MSKIGEQPSQKRLQSKGGAAFSTSAAPIDRTGGKFGAGLMRSVSVLTRGEALGHWCWCDSFMLDQCVEAMQNGMELKSRFTHPDLCSDGLAKGLGVLMNPVREGDQVFADLHFYKSAHKSPDGDLAGYVMDRAEEDPGKFGTSIVYSPDWDAEEEFYENNKVDDEKIGRHFVSPDPDNTDNLPHARIGELWACDVVDDPAANPNGMFHRDLSTIQHGKELMDFALGLSDKRPVEVAFGVDPDRVRDFVQRYLEGGAMTTLLNKGKKLAEGGDETKTPDNGDGTEKAADGEGKTTCPECGAMFGKGAAAGAATTEAYTARHKRYVDAFGAVSGSKWFFEGVSFEDAQEQHFKDQLAAKDEEIAALKAKLQEAETRLAAIAKSGEKPLDASPPPKGTESQKGGKTDFSTLFRKKS